jgi:hypothetical protein
MIYRARTIVLAMIGLTILHVANLVRRRPCGRMIVPV